MGVRTERRGQTLVIWLDRPEKRNAMSREMAEGLERAIEEMESDDGIRAGVLTGAGPVFCAGTDLKDPRDKRTERGGEYGLLRRDRGTPLIAAVNGPALGGGFEIVLACDLIVMSEAATFGLPETRRGLAATGGGLFRAPTSLPYHVALEMMLTGRAVTAARAYALGLAAEVVPADEVLPAAMRLADEIALGGPSGTAETLRAVRGFVGRDDHLGWWMTARAKDAVVAHPDAAEGRAAFAERRTPQWVYTSALVPSPGGDPS
ncbi:enoyl-CoA hydratase-related protein [Phycicoccus sp. DTK01]|uniref:enoyl-CoA hydratase-related protein n=1 Tax=Phycicoccus sp. DTK01 TaxID=2785745 RepID=UPI001A8E82F6|nr:enoyl-CoA hydratase-related protein [Phycicoccus sp. DTK01]GIL34124.1 enoyl-CoA hydratase [Phycicoccus sp. DTK01]